MNSMLSLAPRFRSLMLTIVAMLLLLSPSHLSAQGAIKNRPQTKTTTPKVTKPKTATKPAQKKTAPAAPRAQQRTQATQQRQQANANRQAIFAKLKNDMVYVEGGTFMMGALPNDKEADNDETPRHQVTLSSFYISKYEVTQELWQAVMGSNPSRFKGDLQRPVEQVSWNECLTFINKLNALTGEQFRLPTEAEWEYAARGGQKSRGYLYSGSKNISDVAWYRDNSNNTTHPVGQKQPNELGLYDMTGNVWEWCEDWYGPYSSSAQTNPSGPSSASYRVFRGGGWNCLARFCRASYRNYNSPDNCNIDLGLRLAR